MGRYGPDCDETGEALFLFSSGAIGSLAAAWVDVAEPVTAEISGTEGHAYIRNRSDLYVTCANLDGADGQSPWTDLPAAMAARVRPLPRRAGSGGPVGKSGCSAGGRARGRLPQRGDGGDVRCGRGRFNWVCRCA